MTDRVAGGVMPDPTDIDAINGLVMAADHGMSARRYMPTTAPPANRSPRSR